MHCISLSVRAFQVSAAVMHALATPTDALIAKKRFPIWRPAKMPLENEKSPLYWRLIVIHTRERQNQIRRGVDLARVKVLVVVESALGTRDNKSKSKMCTQQRQGQNVHHHIMNGGFLLMLHNESILHPEAIKICNVCCVQGTSSEEMPMKRSTSQLSEAQKHLQHLRHLYLSLTVLGWAIDTIVGIATNLLLMLLHSMSRLLTVYYQWTRYGL